MSESDNPRNAPASGSPSVASDVQDTAHSHASPQDLEDVLLDKAIRHLFSNILSILVLLVCLAPICLFTPSLNTYFALFFAGPLYHVYPRIVAAMILGGIGGTICSIPVKLSVLAFHWLFNADIRSPSKPYIPSRSRMVWSVVHDAADAARLGIILGPVLVMLVDRKAELRPRVPLDALDAAAGGQLAAALLDMRIVVAWAQQFWLWTARPKDIWRQGVSG